LISSTVGLLTILLMAKSINIVTMEDSTTAFDTGRENIQITKNKKDTRINKTYYFISSVAKKINFGGLF